MIWLSGPKSAIGSACRTVCSCQISVARASIKTRLVQGNAPPGTQSKGSQWAPMSRERFDTGDMAWEFLC